MNYFPYGKQLTNATWTTTDTWHTNDLNYGFNGKWKDNNIRGAGGSLAFEYRIYNSELGVFLSRDPLESLFAFHSPFLFAYNNPILNIDYLGLAGVTNPNGRDDVPDGKKDGDMITFDGQPFSWHNNTWNKSTMPAIVYDKPSVTQKVNKFTYNFLDGTMGDAMRLTSSLLTEHNYVPKLIKETYVTIANIYSDPYIIPYSIELAYDNYQNSSELDKWGILGSITASMAMMAIPGPTGKGKLIPSSRWIKHDIWNQLKKIGIQKKVGEAMNKGLASTRMNSSGIIKLNANEIKKYSGYTHKIKILGKGNSHYRILGKIVKTDNKKEILFFDKLVNN